MRFPLVRIDDAANRYLRMHESWGTSHARSGGIVFRANQPIAFHRPRVGMPEATVALASTGGVHTSEQAPFDMRSLQGDSSIRSIPSAVKVGDLRFTHDHYDHSQADSDPNCMFPLAALRELARDGVIGSVAAHHIGAMGWLPNPDVFMEDVVPRAVQRLSRDAVDVVVLSGGCPVCMRTAGLMQNAIERAGIATVSVTVLPDIALGVGVPRAGYVRFPLGMPFGEPGDAETQRDVLLDLLSIVWDAEAPGSVFALPYRWRRRRQSSSVMKGACG